MEEDHLHSRLKRLERQVWPVQGHIAGRQNGRLRSLFLFYLPPLFACFYFGSRKAGASQLAFLGNANANVLADAGVAKTRLGQWQIQYSDGTERTVKPFAVVLRGPSSFLLVVRSFPYFLQLSYFPDLLLKLVNF